MCVQPNIIISAGTGDCGAVFAVVANWRHFHLLEILLGWDVLCLQDWEWSQFSTLHHHLCLSITTMIVQLAIFGMLTSISNYFSDSSRLRITNDIKLCLFKQVHWAETRFELGWTSGCVRVCYVVPIRFLARQYVLLKTQLHPAKKGSLLIQQHNSLLNFHNTMYRCKNVLACCDCFLKL